MTMTQTQPVDVRQYPPPPRPDILLPFDEALAMMEVLRRHAQLIEGRVPGFEQTVAVIRSVADRLDHAVDQAAWEGR